MDFLRHMLAPAVLPEISSGLHIGLSVTLLGVVLGDVRCKAPPRVDADGRGAYRGRVRWRRRAPVPCHFSRPIRKVIRLEWCVGITSRISETERWSGALPALFSQKNLQIGGWLCGVALGLSILVVLNLQGAQCPPSTFLHGEVYSNLGMMLWLCGIVIALFALVVLHENILASPPRRNSGAIAIAGCGLVVSGAIFYNEVDSYTCATPIDIVIRSNYFDTPRHVTWDDVETVHALCSKTSKGRRSGTLRLALSDGEDLVFDLMDGSKVLSDEYRMLGKSVAGKNYRYDMDSSVDPSVCPAELYPLLKDWRIE